MMGTGREHFRTWAIAGHAGGATIVAALAAALERGDGRLGLAVQRSRPAPRARPALRAACHRGAAHQHRHLAGAADPRVGDQRLPPGEFLYQDFLYDDHGARAPFPDPNDPRTSGNTFSPPNGTYTYPTDNKTYVGNLADLVEFRVKPLSDATAIRVTLNSMTDPTLVGFSVAIGGDPTLGSFRFPHGSNVNAPAAYFLTVHGTTAELVTALGVPVTPPPTVTVDTARRQFEVRIPHAAWDPGTSTVRFAAGVGLWDKANNAYLVPGNSASATTPGGGAGLASPAAFFNVAFRFQHDPGNADEEPMPHVTDLTDNFRHPEWWRDSAQGTALAANNITPFFVNVDFAKLAAGTNDDMTGQPKGVPASGPMDRILSSHTETEQGTDYSTVCGVASACLGELRGRLQPYAIYIPAKKPASGRYGLTLLLHSLGANYNQFEASKNQSEFGDRGSIVITPSGRGPDGWYYDYAGADTFEVWADVAKHFPLDQAWTDLAGYSMGGYGTYKFATQFPDLFAKAQPTVGPPALGIWVPPGAPTGGASRLTDLQLGSLRNIPFLIWDASSDELVPLPGPVQQASDIDALGYRYEFDVFSPAEHLTLAVNDEYKPAADFLGTDKVDLNPPHVTYVYNPSMDFAPDGTAAGHAYWISDVNLRDLTANGGRGTIDARSEAFGVGDPTPVLDAAWGQCVDGRNLPGHHIRQPGQDLGPGARGPEGGPHRPEGDQRLGRVDRRGSRRCGLQRGGEHHPVRRATGHQPGQLPGRRRRQTRRRRIQRRQERRRRDRAAQPAQVPERARLRDPPEAAQGRSGAVRHGVHRPPAPRVAEGPRPAHRAHRPARPAEGCLPGEGDRRVRAQGPPAHRVAVDPLPHVRKAAGWARDGEEAHHKAKVKAKRH